MKLRTRRSERANARIWAARLPEKVRVPSLTPPLPDAGDTQLSNGRPLRLPRRARSAIEASAERRTTMQLTKELDAVLGQFIDAMTRLGWSEHTIRAYRRGMVLFFDWLTREHSMTIDRVTPAIVFAWRDELERWNVAASTKQLRLSAVKTFFSMMHRAGVVMNDAAVSVEIPKWKRLPTKPRPVPTTTQVEQMIESAPAGSRDRAMIEVLYSAGLRGCELRALKVEDVDVENHVVHVRRGKGGQPRSVPIGAAGVAALRAYIARVRPNANRAIFALSARSLRRVVARASRAAGAKFSPHRLRHAFATHLLQRGAQLDEVRQLLGHAWLDTTQIYVHVESRDLAEVHARFHPRG
jgi:site-specific recombinase XerD